MNTNVYLVRHAHSIFTHDERHRPLSERGKQDAKRVAQILNKEQIDVVISSPYARAIETVEEVAIYHQLPVILVDGFKERKLAAQPVADFEAAMDQLWHNEDFSFQGGESNKEAQRRGVKAFQDVLDTYSGKNIVIGTHGNIMTLIMNYYDSSYHFAFWQQLSMPDIYRLTFDQAQRLMEVKRLWEEQEQR